jgi:superoxide dismutase, Cu-Zn family
MKSLIAVAALFAVHAVSNGAELVVTMNAATATGTGAPAGTVRIVETPYGLAFMPSLTGLPPGLHGFHVHENPSCAPGEQNGAMAPAIAAGGHLDPAATKRHGTPWGDGHLGDLPPLYVAADGSASTPVLGPRLKLADVVDRALMIHAGGDNHADHPAPLGGGGGRIVCGVIPR